MPDSTYIYEEAVTTNRLLTEILEELRKSNAPASAPALPGTYPVAPSPQLRELALFALRHAAEPLAQALAAGARLDPFIVVIDHPGNRTVSHVLATHFQPEHVLRKQIATSGGGAAAIVWQETRRIDGKTTDALLVEASFAGDASTLYAQPIDKSEHGAQILGDMIVIRQGVPLL